MENNLSLNKISAAAKTLKVLSHPVRLKVVEFLESGEKNVGSIQDYINLEQAVTSQHLKLMYMNGLLKKRRDKLWLSKKDVAKIIKWTEREMTRIESWDVAPKFNSYYLRELIKLYKFSESEWNQIKWYVASLHDIIELNRNT